MWPGQIQIFPQQMDQQLARFSRYFMGLTVYG
jgi:hypothetical protein